MIVSALEHRGHMVLAVTTGEEALAIIEQRGAELGMLLTDVVMPGMSGVELLERARLSSPDLRAILMSGYTASTFEHSPPPAGVTFLEKPFTLGALDEAIRKALRT